MDFSKPYNRQDFLDFLQDKFLPDDFELNQRKIEIGGSLQKVKQATWLGDVPSLGVSENFPLAIYEAKHISEHDPRVALTNDIFKIMRANLIDRALIVFYSENSRNYRFSLVKIDVEAKGRRTKEKFSNPKRSSFFLGPGAKIHTPNSFLIKKGKVIDFKNLEKRFSVEVVTEEFFKEISNWYFWAIRNSEFPKDVEVEKNGRNIAVIRLITRLIFIWFMKERNLVPKNLFKKSEIKNYLKDLSNKESTYYKAILQNLFFATLNTKQKERKFGSEKRSYKGWNQDYNNPFVFRYHELFKNPNDLKKYFGKIPFLNGGLFECLDDKRNKIIIDGFSRTKKNQPTVPNFLFFSEEKKVDLNSEYGTKNKKYKVRGILDILSTYNFTIDENTSTDQEIALDPELLGKVLENLLASFNPETASTARKATGSYYTPRQIVEYMVTQSLKEYFKTHLKKSKSLDEKIDRLFENGDDNNPFNQEISKKIVGLVNNLKVVDPAAGSGAFLMGILNKLMFILSKIDPENSLWKEAQLKAAKENITDPVFKQKLINQVEEQFKNKSFDYGRKLYLIQNCIYGVDIQQIAVEIAKLRFFIALLVDEKIDKNKENWNIEPLPNLDFKIMQGNSLLEEFEGVKLFNDKFIKESDSNEEEIHSLKQKQSNLQKEYLKLHSENKLSQIKQVELNNELQKIDRQLKEIKKREKDNFEKNSLFDIFSEAKKKVEEFKELQKEFFAPELRNKKDLKEKLNKLEWELIEATLKEQRTTSALKKLEKYKKSNSKPFFLWKLYFAEVFQRENPGFDIVIGNPPYIKEYTDRNVFDNLKSSIYYQGKMDLWYMFACLGIDLLRNKTGILTFIAQNNWVTSYGASKMRDKVIRDTRILALLDFGNFKVFDTAGIQTMVMIFKKDNNKDKYVFDYRKIISNKPKLRDIIDLLNKDKNQSCWYLNPLIYRKNLSGKSFVFSDLKIESVLNKIAQKDNFKLDPVKEVAQGIVCPQDYVNKASQNKLGSRYEIGTGIFIIKNTELRAMNLSKKEMSIVRPFYTTKELHKWNRLSDNKKWIIYTDSSFRDEKKIKEYPKIKEHLDKFKKVITSDNGPYGLHRARDEYFFKDEKIITLRKCRKPTFTYVDFNSYVSATFYVIKTKRINQKYLTALLNSKLMAFWLKYKGKMQGNNYQIDKEPLLELSLINPSNIEQKRIREIVDKILNITKDKNYLSNSYKQVKVNDYERQIDQLVYRLYGLTDEEIKIIEDKYEG